MGEYGRIVGGGGGRGGGNDLADEVMAAISDGLDQLASLPAEVVVVVAAVVAIAAMLLLRR